MNSLKKNIICPWRHAICIQGHQLPLGGKLFRYSLPGRLIHYKTVKAPQWGVQHFKKKRRRWPDWLRLMNGAWYFIEITELTFEIKSPQVWILESEYLRWTLASYLKTVLCDWLLSLRFKDQCSPNKGMFSNAESPHRCANNEAMLTLECNI